MSRMIYFSTNGSTLVLDADGRPMTELSKNWIQLFANYLDEHDEDPTEFLINLPNGDTAKIVETESGYNVKFEE